MLLETSLIVLAASALPPSVARPARPRILGISHVAFRVSSLPSSRSFYEGFLGYRAVEDTVIPLNDRQYVELRPGLEADQDRLDHVALETDDVDAMRRYLASRGIDLPQRTTKDPAGNPAFTVRDPEGRAIELVQHAEDGWPRRVTAATTSAHRISTRMSHAGILVTDLTAAMKFYADVLGLAETWRGSRSGTELSWTNMKVPDGEDYVELMLHAQAPAPSARGSQHHICLEVPDMEEAKMRLLARPYRAAYTRPIEPRVGTNRKRQLNLYDPDRTRVELMEPVTIDGKPVPPSAAPPPRRP